MSPKRGKRVAPPPFDREFDVKHAKTTAVNGREELPGHFAFDEVERPGHS